MSDSTDRPQDTPMDPTAPSDAGWSAPAPESSSSDPAPDAPAPQVAQPSPYEAPPASAEAPPSPYDAQQLAQPPVYGSQPTPYGQPASPYGQQPDPYGAPPAYGQPQPGYGPGPYAAAPQTNGSALALTIISAIGALSCCLITLPSLIFGIIALSKQSSDPVQSAKMAKYGWIAFGICVALAVLAAIGFFAAGSAGWFDDGGYSDYEYDSSY